MKPHISSKKNQALTLFEVMVIIATLMILAAIILPMIIGPEVRAPRINCVSNLKQVDLAARIWEGDNDNKYPMSVSVTNGGAMELVATGNVAGCFQVMSNELSTTKILICPLDMNRYCASNFLTLNRSNISYFLGPDADESHPEGLLSGDDNLTLDGVPVKPGVVDLSSNALISWTSTRHINCGNLGFADGSVAEESNYSMTNWPVVADFTNRLAIP